MKAKLFVAALATLAFASCSETETVEMPSSAAIKFDNAFVGNAVRGMVTTENLQSFKVFGGFEGGSPALTNVFDNVEIKRANSWGPDAANIQYWQAGKEYTFQAYASASTGTASATGVCFTDYTVSPEAIDEQEDLLVTDVVTQTGKATGNSAVPLTFRHALSMVKFTIKNGFPSNVNLTVTGVTLNGVNTKGNYTNNGATGAWSAQNTAENFVFGDIAEAIAVSEGKSTAEMIVLPQTVTGLKVTFTVTATGALAMSKDLTVTLPELELAEGQRVNFVATIDETNIDPEGQLEPIVFNPSVNPWAGYDDNEEGVVGNN